VGKEEDVNLEMQSSARKKYKRS